MKNSKLLLYSLLSFFIYFLFKYAPLYRGTLQKLEHSKASKAFGAYILIKIAGWFLLLFGSLGLLVFIYEWIKRK